MRAIMIDYTLYHYQGTWWFFRYDHENFDESAWLTRDGDWIRLRGGDSYDMYIDRIGHNSERWAIATFKKYVGKSIKFFKVG